MKRRFKKFLLQFLFGDTPPTVVEKQTEVHEHHHHYYPKGDEIPKNYNDGSDYARQGGSILTPVLSLEGVWN